LVPTEKLEGGYEVELGHVVGVGVGVIYVISEASVGRLLLYLLIIDISILC